MYYYKHKSYLQKTKYKQEMVQITNMHLIHSDPFQVTEK